MADAKARKREAAEARVREKAAEKKQKEEEWRRRNTVNDTAPTGSSVDKRNETEKEKPLTTEETVKEMEKLDIHSTSTST